jgi:hypothetical protein
MVDLGTTSSLLRNQTSKTVTELSLTPKIGKCIAWSGCSSSERQRLRELVFAGRRCSKRRVVLLWKWQLNNVIWLSSGLPEPALLVFGSSHQSIPERLQPSHT